MDQAKIDKLIHTLVADINTLALHKSQNGDSWTMQDCKKGVLN